MPYIQKKDRKVYDIDITLLADKIKDASHIDKKLRAGHLNYVITKLLMEVYGNSMRYCDHNEVIGMLECCKLEWCRRKTSPYEDGKIESEGDLE
jgi:hypothetical protein